KLIKQLFGENDVAQIGDVIAILEIEGETVTKNIEISENKISQEIEETETIPYIPEEITSENKSLDFKESSRFYSPLVKSIAQEEGIALQELDKIIGTGAEGRVTKADLLNYVESNKKKDKSLFVSKPFVENIEEEVIDYQQKVINVPVKPISSVSIQPGDEVIEMDRMRKLIADHMISSTQISAHVTSFVEADVTNLVQWRNKVKNNFEKREKEKITFTPIFIEAVAKAIKDLPMINISVNGSQIIKKRDINIGMAAALPNGNLIVPVIKNADQLNMVGLTKSVNDLANRARNNKLQPDEIQGGTFTITNIGGFGNIMGTPIINQPQVAILAVGV